MYVKRTLLALASITLALGLTQTAQPALADAADDTALAVLLTLPIAQPVPSDYTYSRDAFGWNTHDTDSNGCRTRDDILARDLDDTVIDTDGCTVLSGRLDDPYTGTTIDFQRGQATSAAVQIDHVVALHDAWKSGAYAWPNAAKQLYANDPFVLAAVDGPANQAKGDQSADYWLPTNHAARCDYVALQIAIKHKYALSVTAMERTALSSVLHNCPATTGLPADSPDTSLVRMVQGTEPITEIKRGHPFVDQGILESDGKTYEYRGSNAVVRQDMAAFLYRWAGSPDYTPSAADRSRFTDVTSGTPHAKEIWWLAHEGISTGWCSDGRCEFRGMNAVTRQDMAAFMHRLVGDYGPAELPQNANITFRDVTDATPHAEHIMWLARTGVTEGWGSGASREFRGSSAVVRQDMAAFLHRLAGSPESAEAWNTWVRSRYRDVNEKTPHVRDIYWLTLQKISEGWEYVAPAKPTPQPTTPVYYENCAAVWAAGKAPLKRGQPGYRAALDRDGDGVACETKPR